MEWLRVWKLQNVEEVAKHLLIVGDLSGDCANCRELGLAYADVKECPKCHTSFQFVTSRSAGGSHHGGMQIVKRLMAKRTDLTFIDYDDFKTLQSRNKARDFFK